MYSSEYAGVLGKVHRSNQGSFNAEETELCFPQEGSGKCHTLVGKPMFCFLPHGPNLNLSFQCITHSIFFQFQNALVWAIINYLVTLIIRDWALGKWERRWGEELGNGKRLCGAQCDFFPRSCKCSLTLLTSGYHEYDWTSYGKEWMGWSQYTRWNGIIPRWQGTENQKLGSNSWMSKR